MKECPKCKSKNVVWNGSIHNGKEKKMCKDCGRQFVVNPIKKTISKHDKVLIDKMLLEKIPLSGIARVLEISEPWLQKYINKKYKNVKKKFQNPQFVIKKSL